jgi:hypothetical protein
MTIAMETCPMGIDPFRLSKPLPKPAPAFIAHANSVTDSKDLGTAQKNSSTISEVFTRVGLTQLAMAGLSADQRNHYYLQAAIRAGIHKPILAALYAAQRRPSLSDDETGLGVSPANRVPLEQVNTFAEQVQYAANSIRSLTERLIEQGWQSNEIWNLEQGHYSDRFLETVADGYVPSVTDAAAARLEPTDADKLLQAYLEDWTIDCKIAALPQNLGFLDAALKRFVEELPRYYLGASYQRQALLEAARIWRKLDHHQTTVAALLEQEAAESLSADGVRRLEQALLQFVRTLPTHYAGYPHQREALLRLVLLWHQLHSREVAIAILEVAPSAETSIRMIDPALMAFLQRIAQSYQGKGDQRNALTETYRLWYGLESRGAVLQELGVDPQTLTASHPNRNTLLNVATQLDRSLLDFVKQLPVLYRETEPQREALIRLTQLWYGFEGRDQTLQALVNDVQRLETARRDSPDAACKLEPLVPPPRPSKWAPANLQLFVAILPHGSFSWAEATQGGYYLPTHQVTVDTIVHMAELAQQACDRIGRPLRIVRWYCPTQTNLELRSTSQQNHALGDAIEFYCDGLTGDQIYLALSPWWTGGLGRYRQYPYLCYIDARDRTRWTRE